MNYSYIKIKNHLSQLRCSISYCIVCMTLCLSGCDSGTRVIVKISPIESAHSYETTYLKTEKSANLQLVTSCVNKVAQTHGFYHDKDFESRYLRDSASGNTKYAPSELVFCYTRDHTNSHGWSSIVLFAPRQCSNEIAIIEVFEFHTALTSVSRKAIDEIVGELSTNFNCDINPTNPPHSKYE